MVRADVRVPPRPDPPVADADKLTAWLTEHVCCKERRPERVREQFLEHCRDERIEPPAASRAGRIIGSAMRQAEQTLTLRVSARIPPEAAARMAALIAGASDDPGQGDGQEARRSSPSSRLTPATTGRNTEARNSCTPSTVNHQPHDVSGR